jgi:uroporphyrinogen-III decarboxylase
MTDPQWQNLLRVLGGELLDPLPVGLIVDSPWLAGWGGHTVMDYFTDEEAWLATNLKVVRQFPEILFLPGFWAEFGMCTEPSAFGAKCIWPENEFPFAGRTLDGYDAITRLTKPNCRTDGLCPFVIKRLRRCQPRIEAAGHKIRFAVARGPMNIATYLLGHSETLIGVKTNPDEIHRLLSVVTDFLVDWIRYQKEVFPDIDGILLLDDLIGFLGKTDFADFAVPYLKQIFAAIDVSVKALHNDCHGMITAAWMKEMGANLFNFSFEHSLPQMRQAAGAGVVLLGNIPPRDVLARGTSADVLQSCRAALDALADKRWLILSCGGGTPPGVPDANVQALLNAVRER